MLRIKNDPVYGYCNVCLSTMNPIVESVLYREYYEGKYKDYKIHVCDFCTHKLDKLETCSICSKEICIYLRGSIFKVKTAPLDFSYVCIDHFSDGNVVTCGHCGYYTSRKFSIEYNSILYCKDCEYRAIVRDYNYKPEEPVFFGAGSRYFGVELEVSCDQNIKSAKHLKSLVGDKGYLKLDSSIQPQGIEVVTEPMTIVEHRKLWADFCNKVDRDMVYIYNNNNGLHVHIDRNGMSDLLVGKIMKFININDTYIPYVSGRSNAKYACFKDRPISSIRTEEHSKYSALNITPTNTIELRTFKASLDYSKILSAVELSDAVVDYCSQESILTINNGKRELWKNFVLHVQKYKKRWPELYSLHKALGLGRSTKSEVNKIKYENRKSACA